jgi:hypothetical protein
MEASKHKAKDKQDASKLKVAMYNRVKNELPELDKLASKRINYTNTRSNIRNHRHAVARPFSRSSEDCTLPQWTMVSN